MTAPSTTGNIVIGKNSKSTHSWCILCGDDLQSTKDYDIQVKQELTIGANLDVDQLQPQINKAFFSFSMHAEQLGEQGKLWLQQAGVAMYQIMMIIGGAKKCGAKGCTKDATLVCEQCRGIRYCSLQCQKASWSEHKNWCTRVEVRTRDPTSELGKQMLKINADLSPQWYPDSALDKGLFATKKIGKGEMVAFFKGDVCPIEALRGRDIWFHPMPNNKIFIPSDQDTTHLAIDPSFTISAPRALMEVLSTPQSAITTLGNLKNILPTGGSGVCNTALVADATKVGLIATRDINLNEEIFFHRGFSFHFLKESQRGWMLRPEDLPQNLPSNIYSSPGFKEYIILYHPDATDMYITSMPNEVHKVEIYVPAPNMEEDQGPRDPLRVHLDPIPETLKSIKGSRTATMILPDYRAYLQKLG